MTEQVKNLFKHKIPFHSRKNCNIQKLGMSMHDISLYRSMLITYPLAIDIYDSGDVYDKVKSFLHYLVSKHITTKHEGYTYIGSFFEIGITYDSGEDDRDYKKLVTVEVKPETTIHGDVFIFGGPVLKEFSRYKIYSSSIEIDIDAYGCYWEEITEEVESEDEEDDPEEDEEDDPEEEEDTTPIAVSEPFHSDQCVVCLSKKPELLFMNCLHRCVCLECEETNPFRRCPSCRTHISNKVKI